MATTPDLNLLPIAVALYDDLSVSRAARRLGMSQPAVSKALRGNGVLDTEAYHWSLYGNM